MAAALIPLCGLPLVALVRRVALPQRKQSAQFRQVARAIWMPGVAVALSGVGFGAVTTFVVLLYAAHGWTPLWLPFTALSIAFIGGRLGFGHLPDRIGGARVASICMLVEAAGQFLIWQAQSSVLALAGVTLTGLGYSLVYPALGVEAIRRAPPRRRGLAMGSYTAFLDVSLGVTGPALGLVVGRAGLRMVFVASATAILCAVMVAYRLMSLRVPVHDSSAASGIGNDERSGDAAIETS